MKLIQSLLEYDVLLLLLTHLTSIALSQESDEICHTSKTQPKIFFFFLTLALWNDIRSGFPVAHFHQIQWVV